MARAGGEGAPESASTTWAAARASDCGGRHEAGGRLCPKWVLCHLAPLQGPGQSRSDSGCSTRRRRLNQGLRSVTTRGNHAFSPGKQSRHVRLTGVEDEPVQAGHEVRPAWRGHRDSLCTLPVPLGVGFHVGNQGSSKMAIWRDKHPQGTWEESVTGPNSLRG